MKQIDGHSLPLDSLALFLPTIFAFGAGLNSTALAVKWAMDGLVPPDNIFFADTGSERPEVYDHCSTFSEWLVKNGMPAIQIMRKGGRVETLEQNCERMSMLPSLAYGRKGCSHKYKIEPQAREANKLPTCREAWKRGDKVIKIIGYGTEEKKRLAKAKLEDDKYFYRFPLAEWVVDRQECENIIRRAGLTAPGKSSCFFCPAMRKPEIIQMAKEQPELMKRALIIEQRAIDSGNLKTVKGLGRNYAWKDFLAGVAVVEADTAVCMHCVDQEDT